MRIRALPLFIIQALTIGFFRDCGSERGIDTNTYIPVYKANLKKDTDQ